MTTLKIVFGFCISLLMVSGYSQDSTGIAHIFPKDQQFEGWMLKDSVVQYGSDNLYEHAKASTELFLEFGIRNSSMAVYKNTVAVKITLDVFEMDHPDAAWGAFTMLSSGKGSVLELGDAGMKYDYFILLVKGNYFIRGTTTKNGEAYMEALLGMSGHVVESIPSTAKEPALMKVFEFGDLEVKERKYFEGQVGLMEVYNFGHGALAGFEKGSSSRSAEKRYFVFAYESERKRREWFASAKGKMNMNQRFTDYEVQEDGFTALDRNGISFAFKPYKKYILVVKGYTWEEARGTFTQMSGNLDKYLP